jgi:hypothetical protein
MARDPNAQRPWIGAKCLVISVLAWVLTDTVRSEPIPAIVLVCRSQVDELQRLHCYDAAVDSSTQGSKVPVPARDPVLSQRQQAERAEEPAAARASSPAPAVPAKAARTNMPMFSAKVAALSFRPSGAVNVALDNGQVWTQYGPEGRVPLRTGDIVTLRPGLFGASVLVGPSGWITKVHAIPEAAKGPNGN